MKNKCSMCGRTDVILNSCYDPKIFDEKQVRITVIYCNECYNKRISEK